MENLVSTGVSSVDVKPDAAGSSGTRARLQRKTVAVPAVSQSVAQVETTQVGTLVQVHQKTVAVPAVS